MTDLLDDIVDHFIDSNLLEEGEVFTDTMPDEPDDAAAVYEYAGSGVPAQVAGAHRSVQVVVRSTSATTAKLKIRELYKALDTEDYILKLPNGRWCMVYLRQTPFKIKVDSQNRYYYGFNVGFTTYAD